MVEEKERSRFIWYEGDFTITKKKKSKPKISKEALKVAEDEESKQRDEEEVS